MAEKFATFKEFYAFYLSEHQNRVCRMLHFLGSMFVLMSLVLALMTQHWYYLAITPILGYGFAWMGHLFFEKNQPATFSHPFYSLVGDWVMFKDILCGRIKIL